MWTILDRIPARAPESFEVYQRAVTAIKEVVLLVLRRLHVCKNVVSPVDLAVVVGMRVGAYVAHAEAAALAVLDGSDMGHGALVVVAASNNV